MIERIYDGASIMFQDYDHSLRNVFMFDWESDLFGISRTGYSIEIEVKLSRSDFFADFKKPKHEYFKRISEKKDFIITNKREFDEVCYLDIFKIKDKIPNRFFFACPEGLIKPEEVPSYAGLIYCETRYSNYDIEKKAPILHRNKIDFTHKLLSKYKHINMNAKFDLARLINDHAQKDHMSKEDLQEKMKKVLKRLK